MTLTSPLARAYDADLGVFVMRAQPYTEAHGYCIRETKSRAKKVVVMVGSHDEPRTPHYNAFTSAERIAMAKRDLADLGDGVIFVPIHDQTYATHNWVKEVRRAAHMVCDTEGLSRDRVSLSGFSKDASSFYIDLFPEWGSINHSNFKGLSATPFRLRYFGTDDRDVDDLLNRRNENLPLSTLEFLEDFRSTTDYEELRRDLDIIMKRRAQYSAFPYPVTLNTVDAAVFQSGKVLLAVRNARPQAGKWMLPSRYLPVDDYITNATVKTLRDLTAIKVPEGVLRGSLTHQQHFDHPMRSPMARTIAHVSLFDLKPGRGDDPWPKVRANDSSIVAAQWWALEDLKRDMFYQDHFYLIKALEAKLKERE